MVATGTPRPWSPGLSHLRPVRLHLEPSAAHDPLVLLHQGFLIETAHVWRQLANALRAAGREPATLDEHYLRTIDSAHALGHDPDLALAQSLAGAIDDAGARAVDLVAEGTGAGPALLLALNDPRVRRVVLWRPARVGVDTDGALTPSETSPREMTDAEVSIGVLCAHSQIDVLRPNADVRLALADLDVPVLIIDEAAAPLARSLHARIPSSELLPSADRRLLLTDDLLIKRVLDFLATPLAHAQV